MDVIDKKILLLLTENCRFPNSYIAKQLKISEQLVKYRIERMETLGIIKGHTTVIILNSFGILRYYAVYLKLKKTSISEKKDILDYLQSNKHTVKLFECDGPWNIGFEICSALQLDIKNILDNLQRLARNQLEDMKVFNIGITRLLKRLPFFESKYQIRNSNLVKKNSSFQKELLTSKNIEFFGIAKMEDIDLKILTALEYDGKISLMSLATKISSNVQTVKKHILSMIQKGIIKQFTIIVDYEKLGFKKVILLFNILRDNKKQEELIQYAYQKYPSLHMVTGYLDYWNFGFIAYFKDIDEIDKIIEDLLLNFRGVIFDYIRLLILKEIKRERVDVDINKIYNDAISLLKPL